MEEKLTELKRLLREAEDMDSVRALLNWDQSTYMPPGGAPARGRQMALISGLAHERATSPAIGRLLDELQPYTESLAYDDEDAAYVRVARRNYEKAIRIPPAFMARLTEHMTLSYQAWTRARPANDFATMQPLLDETLDLSRQIANYFPGYDHIADPLIDFADEGMKAETIRELFGRLRAELVPLLQDVLLRGPVDDSFLHQPYDINDQKAFGEMVARDFGYDFERGRQDITYHPFMTKFSLGDVRITTRYDENWLSDGLFSTLHETGHALYEQGINPAYEASPLGHGTSAGVHESQSRTWENLVGRSRPFWEYYYPLLQDVFPNQLGAVDLQSFYRAVNKVEPSLIRTEADQMTYDLHVMIRFDLELALLEGTLAIADLPDAWHARYESDLGLHAPDNSDGVLQDVHWYGGIIGGAFQGYTLGNIMSASFFDAAVEVHPEIIPQMAQGEFATLHAWLKDNIYLPGARYTADELVLRVTGEPLTIQPYVNYLRNKFGAL